MSRPLVRLLLVALALPAVLGCVAYRPAAVTVSAAASSLPASPVGPLAFPAAVGLLVDRNVELRRLRAEVAAVNLRPGPEPLRGSVEVEGGEPTKVLVGTDVLALFGVGRRPAEAALARAERDERVLAHHERARALVAALAEAYAVDGALGALASPRPDLGLEAFRAAGLAAGTQLAAAEAVLTRAAAEETIARTTRADARREIARLVGARPGEAVEPVLPPDPWPPVPSPQALDLLYARGDLVRARASFAVADRRLRLAVARQWPTLEAALGAEVSLADPMQMFAVVLPLDAPAEARAMAEAREAARLGFEEAVLDALHDAAAARLALESAEARVLATASQREAAAALVRAARARATVAAEDAFPDVVMAGLEEVRAAAELRDAVVERARARARAALAAGWPGPREVEGLR